MSEEGFDVFEEANDDTQEEDELEDCYGEYGRSPLCVSCPLQEKCRKLKEAEKNISKRYKGKYTGTGKEKGKDRY